MKKRLIAALILLPMISLAGESLLSGRASEVNLKNEREITVGSTGSFRQLTRTLEPQDKQIATHFPFELEITGDGLRDWVTFGTAGLKKESQHSYTFLAFADPETNEGYLFGWLTQYSGSGSVELTRLEDKALLRARLDYGNKLTPENGRLTSELFLAGYFHDIRKGLAEYADALVQEYEIRLKPQPELYCTWYHTWGASSPYKIRRNSQFAAKNLVPWGFDVIQLDDKWQDGDSQGNGPHKNFTRTAPKGKYRKGMRATADTIRSLGMTAGLWFMPFAGSWNDPWFADKQHYFVKRTNGEPFDTFWGGTCLDMTHPEVQDYLAGIVKRISDDWGYHYFKIDGLWTGTATDILYINKDFREDNIDDAHFHNPRMSNIEAYRKGLEIVNDASGNRAFVLGCNLAQNMRVLGGSFGLVDAMRVGADNNANWEEMKIGPWSINTLYFLNKKVWYNDPDPLYVRNSVPYNEARTLASFVAFTGSLHTTSVQFSSLSQKRVELIQKTIPTHDQLAIPQDLLQSEIAKVWTIKRKKSGDLPEMSLAGFFNWEEEDTVINFRIEESGFSPEDDVTAFSFWEQKLVPVKEGNINIRLKKADCRILSLKQRTKEAQIIGTNRHIGNGLVEILSEKSAERKLSATIKVPPMKEFKLFLIPPAGEQFTPDKIVAKLLSGEASISEIETAPDLLTLTLSPEKLSDVSITIAY